MIDKDGFLYYTIPVVKRSRIRSHLTAQLVGLYKFNQWFILLFYFRTYDGFLYPSFFSY